MFLLGDELLPGARPPSQTPAQSLTAVRVFGKHRVGAQKLVKENSSGSVFERTTLELGRLRQGVRLCGLMFLCISSALLGQLLAVIDYGAEACMTCARHAWCVVDRGSVVWCALRTRK